jgi:predicted small secreted protein
MNMAVKKLTGIVLVAMMLVGVVGCETMKGVGKDLSNLGDKIEKKAGE